MSQLWGPVWIALSFAACGDDGPTSIPDGQIVMPDASNTCLPQSAVGSFYRRQPNPRFIAGRMFSDGKLDTAIADPDLRWDGAQWHLYYQTPHGTTFDPPGPQIIRHATSSDLATWTFDETSALAVSAESAAWDSTHTETPSVAYNPDAPTDRRYLMMYSGAAMALPGYTFPAYSIGAASTLQWMPSIDVACAMPNAFTVEQLVPSHAKLENHR